VSAVVIGVAWTYWTFCVCMNGLVAVSCVYMVGPALLCWACCNSVVVYHAHLAADENKIQTKHTTDHP
jgi:hypothetical protein